ncbi:OLC1v1001695C1 [Oldenlandia corymbosa var. corymbosa]|uniref:RING-type E3 ubiquitin transferase n=1 Tax=Oldenlandia corymbosa var. corymbosa TaxID=529605 RepID=A0AAV1D5V0_OLDCO|nr:OLC1v1001695C1 [Oldenlandia corymbosa var. corymbosa]
MSLSRPTTATATTDTDNSSAAVHHVTYWCHECDMSVLLPRPLSSTSPPLCPHCRHDFLEQMDSFPPPPNPTASANHSAAVFQSMSPMDSDNPFPFPSASPADDTFLLDSPYFHRLVNNLMTADTPVSHHNHPINPPQYNSPASKSAIESLHHVVVDSAFLEKDPTVVCPVCKDQFLINSEAKLLPCNHAYHADCIIPWLQINCSCPVCRHRLPTENEARKHEVHGGERFIGAARLDELLDEEQDLFGFTSILRNVVRRQQQSNRDNEMHLRNVENWNRRVVWDNDILFSPTQIGEAESGGGSGRRGDHVERANSVETVTSWPMWPVEGGASGSGSGDGDVAVGVSSGRGISEGDAVMS